MESGSAAGGDGIQVVRVCKGQECDPGGLPASSDACFGLCPCVPGFFIHPVCLPLWIDCSIDRCMYTCILTCRHPSPVCRSRDASQGQNTPLHLASEHGHEGIVKLLLDAGANAQAEIRYVSI